MRHQRAAVVAAVLAVVLLGVVTVRDRATDDPGPVTPAGTVTAAATTPVDVVDLSTPEQAAIAVSSRLFARADVAVLTDEKSTRQAISAAERLGVPVLLDDPAVPAELTRLRVGRVLTFGTVTATGAAEVDELADAQPSRVDAIDVVVLMKSTATFAVAAANAELAGATVVESSRADLRRDPATTKVLAQHPGAAVIALGAPFGSTFAYSLAAVRNAATQIGGGYFALPERRFVGLHGIVGDRTAGILGRQDLSAALTRVQAVADTYAENDDRPIVPMIETVAAAGDDVADRTGMTPEQLAPVVQAAEAAGVYVVIEVGTDDLLAQAQQYEDLLARPTVGLSLDPGRGGTSASAVNAVVTWLADLTLRDALPQKLLLVHESTPDSIDGRAAVDTERAELAVVLDVAVTGDREEKLAAWRSARTDAPDGAFFGWRHYSTQDTPMFTVRQTYRLIDPYPSVLTYE
jgi:hypothetical protein